MDLTCLEKWVLTEYGMDLTAYKSTQLHRRILSLMSRVGANSVNEYIEMLKRDPGQKQRFLDFITINVTEFFRNPELFDELGKQLAGEVQSKSKGLKIWSAACSTGAEPYSLAMMLDEIAPGKNHQIIATDIDETILKKARMGKYVEAELKNVSSERMSKYFSRQGNEYIVTDKIKSMVTFKKHDLIMQGYEDNFDLIVCRNVVIYFKTEIKTMIYEKFHRSLNSGGLLFVGATESIYNYKQFGFGKASTFIYRKI